MVCPKFYSEILISTPMIKILVKEKELDIQRKEYEGDDKIYPRLAVVKKIK